MLRVCEYIIPTTPYFSLELPQGAIILSVQEQHGKPQICALVNLENPIQARKFHLAGIDTPITITKDEKLLNCIGEFQLTKDNPICHLFEIIDL